MRLDNYLFQHNLAQSRSRAKNIILMSSVKVDGNIIDKPSFDVSESSSIEVLLEPFASLGAFKLEKALTTFNFSPKDLVCLDIGASNGGFTEVLLKNGAKKVIALDVGECCLPEYLKNDKRVHIMDKTNARYVTTEDIGEIVDFIVIDVSFISLKLVLPNAKTLLKENGFIVALIKPQFEATKKDLSKKGIILSEKTQNKIILDIKEFCLDMNFKVINIVQSPENFQKKNKEWLIFLQSF